MKALLGNKLINTTNFKNIMRHELISGAFYMFLGGMVGSFLVFLLSLFLARKLSYAEYGTYVSLLSLLTLLTIPAGSLSATIVHFATKYFASNDISKASSLYKKMIFLWFFIGLMFFIGIFLLSPILLNFLHIQNTFLIFLVALTVGITYLGIVNNAFIQSLTKFAYLSFSALVGSIFRVVIAGVLVLLGFGVVGAILGIVVFPLGILLLNFIPLLYLLKKNQEKSSIDFREIIFYAIPVSIGLLAMSSFITSDVILVKHFFSARNAGLYGGLSIVGKVIFYFTAAIPSVMFPLVVKRHTKGENYRNIYLLAMLLTLIPSFAITAFYFLFSNFTINLFLGGKEFLKVAPLLGLYGIFISLYNLLSLTINYFLSIKKTFVTLPIIIFAILQIILIYLFHGSFADVIHVSILSVSLLLLTLTVYYKLQKD